MPNIAAPMEMVKMLKRPTSNLNLIVLQQLKLGIVMAGTTVFFLAFLRFQEIHAKLLDSR
jgi:hypothetical protein